MLGYVASVVVLVLVFGCVLCVERMLGRRAVGSYVSMLSSRRSLLRSKIEDLELVVKGLLDVLVE
jgi:hypothetical protein